MTIQEYGNTVIRMKTTIELPDELVVAAKKRAAELRRPLRTLVENGLRGELRLGRARRASGDKPIKLRWITVEGGLPPDLDVADRAAMQEWLRAHK